MLVSVQAKLPITLQRMTRRGLAFPPPVTAQAGLVNPLWKHPESPRTSRPPGLYMPLLVSTNAWSRVEVSVPPTDDDWHDAHCPVIQHCIAGRTSRIQLAPSILSATCSYPASHTDVMIPAHDRAAQPPDGSTSNSKQHHPLECIVVQVSESPKGGQMVMPLCHCA